ncbi:MAG TPA: transcriptional repressor [Bdellovibrionales bacterium]|nr:transcriptional repressor [Bdellovibrionales bacterium]
MELTSPQTDNPKQPNPTYLKQVIRDLGLKVTQQRMVILETLLTGRAHVTAQEVFEVVCGKAPDVGFATVYRFLRTLCQHGYVTEVRMGGLPARYEWAKKKHHDHLTCVRCRRICEFENLEIENLQVRIAQSFGFQLTNHLLELYGVCAECQKAPDRPQILA